MSFLKIFHHNGQLAQFELEAVTGIEFVDKYGQKIEHDVNALLADLKLVGAEANKVADTLPPGGVAGPIVPPPPVVPPVTPPAQVSPSGNPIVTEKPANDPGDESA